MKRTGWLLLLSFFSVSAFSQMRVAISGGVHGAKVIETNELPYWDSVSQYYGSRTGAHIGFTADIPFGYGSRFSFQPGVLFYNKGRKYNAFKGDSSLVANPDSSDYISYLEERKEYLNYIDLPLHLVYKAHIKGKTSFMIGAGPYVSFFYNGKTSTSRNLVGQNFSFEENNDLPVGKARGAYRTLDFGVSALAGFEFGKIYLTANFSNGLTDFYQASSYDGSFRHQVAGATLGVYLGRPISLAPKDSDNDGIPDEKDGCPDQPGTEITGGCPDQDGDGIADAADKCPALAGTTAYEGCPIPDSDGDGINDENDKCPQMAGLEKYAGCPIPDSDGDGINDEKDKCPEQAGVARYQGCPVPDADGDGINDEDDACPMQAGSAENNGCPAIEKVTQRIDSAAKKIEFELNKAVILPSSYATLDDIAQALQENPDLEVEIQGHTSREGNYEYNLQLSQRRAEAVKAYFETKGIDSERLKAKGYGPDQPLNEGRTEAERKLNRRVEIKLRQPGTTF